MTLSDAEIQKLAALAHLHVDPSSASYPALKAGLEDFLCLVEHIKTIASEEVSEQTCSPAHGKEFADLAEASVEAAAEKRLASLRPDVVTDGNCAEEVLQNAAVKEGSYFAVPKVME